MHTRNVYLAITLTKLGLVAALKLGLLSQNYRLMKRVIILRD